jgi:hypothetical protein
MTLTSKAIVAAVIESPMNSIERSSKSRKYGQVTLPGRNRASQPGVQAGKKALRIRHINGMEVRKKRPRGLK